MEQDLAFIAVAVVAVGLGLMLWSTIRRGGRTVWNTSGVNEVEFARAMAQPVAPDVTTGFPRFRHHPGQVEIVSQRADMTVFDYRVIHDPGGATQRIVRLPCAVADIAAMCPPLTISRSAALDPAASDAFLPQIGFESGLFNEQIEVRCGDERFAKTLIDQRMMEWLLLLPPGCGIETARDRVLAFGRESERAMQTGTVVDLLGEFLAHVPPVVSSLYPPTG